MHFRVAFITLALVLTSLPALAQETSSSGLAPADEYFGHARVSVLGIANMIRDSGNRLRDAQDQNAVLDGPLAFVADAIRDWERQYPNDPWIAKDLFKLEHAYLQAQSPRGVDLARRTVAWLVHDYPAAPCIRDARDELAQVTDGGSVEQDDGDMADVPSSAWERFASDRAPLPPDSR